MANIMATIYDCPKCGESLDLSTGKTIVKCDCCGAHNVLPKLNNDDRRANLYNRANHLRRNNEFDKAEGIYETILNEDPSDAEAYWSLVLCRYGIEYVVDPQTHNRIPTVNRIQFTSIYDNENYKAALQYADDEQRRIYEYEAQLINDIQRKYLAISQKEEPFDIFICYKESDEHGNRTPDSVLAEEIYNKLEKEGYKVFFSRITLEGKLGMAYEPYIFSALNSAKLMLVIGTKAEYLNAVWVKNEWSRYLSLINQSQDNILIPIYRNMDPYELPKEFSHLQAQDASKLGWDLDLIRFVKKLFGTQNPTQGIPQNGINTNVNTNTNNTNADKSQLKKFMTSRSKAVERITDTINERSKIEKKIKRLESSFKINKLRIYSIGILASFILTIIGASDGNILTLSMILFVIFSVLLFKENNWEPKILIILSFLGIGSIIFAIQILFQSRSSFYQNAELQLLELKAKLPSLELDINHRRDDLRNINEQIDSINNVTHEYNANLPLDVVCPICKAESYMNITNGDAYCPLCGTSFDDKVYKKNRARSTKSKSDKKLVYIVFGVLSLGLCLPISIYFFYKAAKSTQ